MSISFERNFGPLYRIPGVPSPRLSSFLAGLGILNMGERRRSIDGKNEDHQEIENLDNGLKDVSKVEITAVDIPNRAELERKFVRKLDFRLLPLMMLICRGSMLLFPKKT